MCGKPTAESLARALEELLGDRDRARRIADAGRAYVGANHAISEMAERTVAAYRHLAINRATFRIKE